MLQKIKDLMQIKEQIDEIIDKTRNYNETISSLKNELNELKNERTK